MTNAAVRTIPTTFTHATQFTLPYLYADLTKIFSMSQIEISRENFFYNINQIANKTQSLEKIALVLKDNAYGHGLEIVANLAAKAGVRHAVVRKMAEAKLIEHLFETVLVLTDTPLSVPSSKVRVAVNDFGDIERLPKGCSVELKLDTGMHRNGIESKRFEEAVEAMEEAGLKLCGVMTHYRSADEIGSDFFWQKKRFDEVRSRGEKLGLKGVRWHSCNSAALFRSGMFDEDIARVGIAAYGCLRMPKPFNVPKFRPVMSLWAERIASRDLSAGARVGYGGDGEIEKAGRFSSYDIGYGDGWPRAAYTLPDGRSILGRVSMDIVTIEGDDERVCLFYDAAEAAKRFGTISYEIMTGLNPAIKRVVV